LRAAVSRRAPGLGVRQDPRDRGPAVFVTREVPPFQGREIRPRARLLEEGMELAKGG